MNSDTPLMHPEDDGQDRTPGQSQPFDNVTPEEWFMQEATHLANQYAGLAGLDDDFHVTFRIEDAIAHGNRMMSVFQPNQTAAEIRKLGVAMTGVRNQLTLNASTIMAVVEQNHTTNYIDDESRDEIRMKLQNLKGMVMQALHMMNAIDVSCYETANLLEQLDRIDAKRVQRRIGSGEEGRTVDLSPGLIKRDSRLGGSEGGGLPVGDPQS